MLRDSTKIDASAISSTYKNSLIGVSNQIEEKINKAVSEVFSFKPADIISQLNLLRPIYKCTTNYGHFGRENDLDSLTWEQTNRIEDLNSAVGLRVISLGTS